MKNSKPLKHPEKISSYFKAQIPVLTIVTISGLIYNIGMTAGPYFEGKLVQQLYDVIKGNAVFLDMVHLAVLYVIVIAIVQVARAVKRFGVRRFANNTSASMRQNLYNSLVHATDKQLAHENLGSLLTKAIADVDACAEGMRKFTTEIFDTGVVMIAYAVMLFYYDWRLTLLCFIFTPIAYIAANRMKTYVTSANAAYKKSASSLSGATMDRIQNALTYRVYGREENRNEGYENNLRDYETKSARANLLEGCMTPLYDAIAMFSTVLIIYFGAKNINGTGWKVWDLAAFTTYLSCYTKLAVKTSHAAKLFNAVQKAKVSWNRVQPFMKEPVEDSFVPDDVPLKRTVLSVQDLSCGYTEEPLLSHVSFHAVPGEIIGITGETASGKSLLGRVLAGELPYTGSITLNGKELSSLSEEEKLSAITYMGHDPELLSMSMADNVTLGRQTDPDVYLQMSCLDTDLKDMQETSAMNIGEAGSKLSGGQQARLALARAFAHARSILILDDPFASVDRHTETAILNEIRKNCKDRIVLIISHRLYHFPDMDHVLYLEKHTGIYGTHEEVMAKAPGYKDLYDLQKKGCDLDEKQ